MWVQAAGIFLTVAGRSFGWWLLGSWRRSPRTKARRRQTTPALDIPGFAKKLENKEVGLLDIRSAAEWEAGHVEGSIHAPYQKLRDGKPDEIRNTLGKPLTIVCRSGVRSALAATIPRRSGIQNVEHVADGGVPDLAGEGIGLVEGE
jgi:hydroxyacylglutathione hydrolase